MTTRRIIALIELAMLTVIIGLSGIIGAIPFLGGGQRRSPTLGVCFGKPAAGAGGNTLAHFLEHLSQKRRVDSCSYLARDGGFRRHCRRRR